MDLENKTYRTALDILKERVYSARYRAAFSVILYHHIGSRILESQESQG